jgi:predicted metal-dependent phosphoesterase TrpH
MAKEIKADLHLHTCLSPCGELEMVPTAIVKKAKEVGLDILAVCDHNSVENVQAVARAAEKVSIPVIPGIEITSREEVHILGLFRSQRDLNGIQSLIDENLTGENDADYYGPQVVVDERDQPIELNTKLLIGATALTVEQVVDAIHRYRGLAIASHIDREGFGIIGQLGFIPEGLALDALEVSPRASLREWNEEWSSYPVITSSDAHRLEEIGKSATSFLAEAPSFDEIEKALARVDGRRVVIH